jgi:hypothetical protein
MVGGSWPKGFYEQQDVLEKVMDAVRREVERCDSLQGFQVLSPSLLPSSFFPSLLPPLA